MGRPSKLTETMLHRVKMLALKGFTEAEIAHAVGVTANTIANWKKANPDFLDALKNWKASADRLVERSLYQRACGYDAPDTKFATHEGQITDQVEYVRHHPPDTTACIFWLKNRDRARWRDKVEHGVTDKDGNDVLKKMSDKELLAELARLTEGKK